MKNDSMVSISGKEGPFRNVKNAISRLDLTPLRNKKILIKPNIGRAARPGRGYNTHPLAIAAVAEVLLDAGVAKVAIGESPLVGVDTMEAFGKAGVSEVAKKYGIALIDLDAFPPVTKEIEDGRVLRSTKVCSPVYDFDIIVSVPVAKTHMHTGITLGIKNMKGCLYRHEKVRYHQLEYLNGSFPEKTLDSAISDLATILLPDFTVIDGFIGMEGLGPSGGEPVQSDFAIASWHPLAADIYGCILMGIDPYEVPHLRLISERMTLSLNPGHYKVSPPSFMNYSHPYKRPPHDISIEFEGVQIHDQESCSACVSTLMLFLRRFRNDMTPYVLNDGKFHIAIGKGVKDAPEGTFYVGNCTLSNREKGIVVKGCPPVPTRIYETIVGQEPDENEPEVE